MRDNDKTLPLQGASKPPCTPQPAEGSQGLDPVTGQRSASSTLARRKIKKNQTALVVFFAQLSAQASSTSIQREKSGSRSLHLEDLFSSY